MIMPIEDKPKDPIQFMGDFIDHNFHTTPESLELAKQVMKGMVPPQTIISTHDFFCILVKVCEETMIPKHLEYTDPYTGEVV